MIVLNPITLKASKFLSTMTSLIGDIRNHDTLSAGAMVNNLVDSCRIGNVEYGKGIIYNFKVAPLAVEDLSETSVVTRIRKPQVAQETIEIDTYKFTELSTSEILSRDAFLAGEGVNTFLDFVGALIGDTIRFHYYDMCNNLYQNWTPARKTQTIYIDQLDTSGLSGADLQNALAWNGANIAKVMRKTVNNMQLPNNDYTDIASVVDINNPSQQREVISCLAEPDLKIVFNDEYYTNFLADTIASLYHSDRVEDMIPSGRFVLLPTSAMSEENKNTIAWVSDKMKFAFADFYRVTLAFLDASTLYNNSFAHFAYGSGVFKYAPGVKFVARIVDNVVEA